MAVSSSLSYLFIAFIAILCIVVIAVVAIRRKNSRSSDNDISTTASAAANNAAAAPSVPMKTVSEAPGSAGEIKLYNVPDKQAAMVMAIVADHLKTPLNQLHFISIKQLD